MVGSFSLFLFYFGGDVHYIDFVMQVQVQQQEHLIFKEKKKPFGLACRRVSRGRKAMASAPYKQEKKKGKRKTDRRIYTQPNEYVFLYIYI